MSDQPLLGQALSWEATYLAVIPTATLAEIAAVDVDALDFEAIAGADAAKLSRLLTMFESTETLEARHLRQVLADGIPIVAANELLAEADTMSEDHARAIPNLVAAGDNENRIQPGLCVTWETTYLAVIPTATLAAAASNTNDLSGPLAMFENTGTVETRHVRVVLAGGVQVVTAGELLAEADRVVAADAAAVSTLDAAVNAGANGD
jgi:hypothetical protein